MRQVLCAKGVYVRRGTKIPQVRYAITSLGPNHAAADLLEFLCCPGAIKSWLHGVRDVILDDDTSQVLALVGLTSPPQESTTGRFLSLARIVTVLLFPSSSLAGGFGDVMAWHPNTPPMIYTPGAFADHPGGTKNRTWRNKPCLVSGGT